MSHLISSRSVARKFSTLLHQPALYLAQALAWSHNPTYCLCSVLFCKFVICLPTKHLGVHMNSFKRVRTFQIELEFGNVGFWREGKTGVPGEKPLGAKERTNNKLNPHMASTAGFEPRPHWWEASAVTTAPPLSHHLHLRTLPPLQSVQNGD